MLKSRASYEIFEAEISLKLRNGFIRGKSFWKFPLKKSECTYKSHYIWSRLNTTVIVIFYVELKLICLKINYVHFLFYLSKREGRFCLQGDLCQMDTILVSHLKGLQLLFAQLSLTFKEGVLHFKGVLFNCNLYNRAPWNEISAFYVSTISANLFLRHFPKTQQMIIQKRRH